MRHIDNIKLERQFLKYGEYLPFIRLHKFSNIIDNPEYTAYNKTAFHKQYPDVYSGNYYMVEKLLAVSPIFKNMRVETSSNLLLYKFGINSDITQIKLNLDYSYKVRVHPNFGGKNHYTHNNQLKKTLIHIFNNKDVIKLRFYGVIV